MYVTFIGARTEAIHTIDMDMLNAENIVINHIFHTIPSGTS